MGLLKKITRTIRGNLHELLDKCENPKALLHGSLLDMEHAIRELSRRTVEAVAGRNLILQQLEKIQRRMDLLNQRAYEAAKGDQDVVAKGFIKQSYELNEQKVYYEEEVKEAEVLINELKEHLAIMKEKYSQAQQQKNLLLTRYHLAELKEKKAQARSYCRGQVQGCIRSAHEAFEGDVFNAFEEKLQQKLAKLEAHEELHREFHMMKSKKESEMVDSVEVEKELQRLKEKISS